MTRRRSVGCPHDGSDLVAYPDDSLKAGRTYCVQCNCSFSDGALTTTGLGCNALPASAVSDTQEPADE